MKDCPKCGFSQESGNMECPMCGIVFAKYHSRKEAENLPGASSRPQSRPGFWGIVSNILFFVKPEIHPFVFGGRALVLLVLTLWGIIMAFSPLDEGGSSLWHLVNLPFHEAGHIIFRPFGDFTASLGGTLGQLLMPLICLVVLLVQTRDPFGGAVCLWWLGENFLDIAPYINDARSLKLMLIGGVTGAEAAYGFHDWEFILKELGIVRFDHVLARISFSVGVVLMILSVVWGGYVLYRQYRNLA